MPQKFVYWFLCEWPTSFDTGSRSDV